MGNAGGITGATVDDRWDDGLIARRAAEMAAGTKTGENAGPETGPADEDLPPLVGNYGGALRTRLDALNELVGLSRTRLETDTLAEAGLAEAGRVLDEAAARQRLSARHTVVAVAGPTGSGKSSLFNALAGVPVSETGLRRPTTSAPIALSWSEGSAGLLDRLAVPSRLRRRPLAGGAADEELQGLVLIDLPDHDSAVTAHRDQVDRVLGLVDAVIWVVDPEKYADAVLHERYLRPLAGHAEVTFVVLNQIDRLGGEAADIVLDDLRRLLDEDGMALGEHGEPGATVLALSALTGEGVGELRELLGRFVQERTAPARRLSADVDAAAARLRPAYVSDGQTGLGERAREAFAGRLAVAVGATAAGEAAERVWRRGAIRACGTLAAALPLVRAGPLARLHRPPPQDAGGGRTDRAPEGGTGGTDRRRRGVARAAGALGTGGARGGGARGRGAARGARRTHRDHRRSGRPAAAARLVAGRRPRPGAHDVPADLRRVVVGRPDRRRGRAGVAAAGPHHDRRHRRRAAGGVGVRRGREGAGPTVRAGGRAEAAGGGGRVRAGAGVGPDLGGADAVSGGARPVRDGVGDPVGHAGDTAGRRGRYAVGRYEVGGTAEVSPLRPPHG